MSRSKNGSGPESLSVEGVVMAARDGAFGGFVATVPMTAAMELMRQELPWYERYPLPPSQITARVTEAVGLRKHMDRETHTAATLASHFGYGAAAGSLYAVVAEALPLPGWLKGTLYGLAVWTVSYLGWLPAAGILPPATEQAPRRNLLMIAAHVVWGLTLGLLVEKVYHRGHSG